MRNGYLVVSNGVGGDGGLTASSQMRRDDSEGKCRDKDNRRSPSGMTTRKAKGNNKKQRTTTRSRGQQREKMRL
jgi:hypothetical protein